MQIIKLRISSKVMSPSDFVKATEAFYKVIESIGSSEDWEA